MGGHGPVAPPSGSATVRVPSTQLLRFFTHICYRMCRLATTRTEKTNARNATSGCSGVDICRVDWTTVVTGVKHVKPFKNKTRLTRLRITLAALSAYADGRVSAVTCSCKQKLTSMNLTPPQCYRRDAVTSSTKLYCILVIF